MVLRVIDGDTILIQFVDEKVEKLRLIGVDTPETKHPKKPVEFFGKEASNFTKQMLE
jgi:micrococcal nuclease